MKRVSREIEDIKRVLSNPMTAREIDAASDRAFGRLRGSSAPRVVASLATDPEVDRMLEAYHGARVHYKRAVHDPEIGVDRGIAPYKDPAITDTSAPAIVPRPWATVSRAPRSRETSAPREASPEKTKPTKVLKRDGTTSTIDPTKVKRLDGSAVRSGDIIMKDPNTGELFADPKPKKKTKTKSWVQKVEQNV